MTTERDAHERRDTLLAAGWERVHVENSYYDGPVTGVADVEGRPHHFERLDLGGAEDGSRFLLWPTTDHALRTEKEQFAMFQRWIAAGGALPDPASAGPEHQRYVVIERMLSAHRDAPDTARVRRAEWASFDSAQYRPDGPGYLVRWGADAGSRS
ncbi:hypothetical protein [Microbacterium sp. NPDC087868]|uniref:hypothetical protein n=1 Tax=Microbacterium sp. NPDC087868 TaxID=3364195 RepID=UPI00384F48C4